MFATAGLGVGAVLWGIATESRVILFDGVYMLAGIVLVAVSMIASRAATMAPSREYPFGRHAARPLAIALQGSAILGTLVYGVADALVVIFAGGSDNAPIGLIMYGVATAVASLILTRWLGRLARESDLARAEVVSWRASAMLSVMVAAGGVIGLVLLARHNTLARYIDPVLLLIACALVTPMAVALIRDGVRELLEAAPPADVQSAIDDAVEVVRLQEKLPAPAVRATKLGQRLYVEVDFLVPAGQWSVDDEDRVRRAVIERLEYLDLSVWASVDLTTQNDLID